MPGEGLFEGAISDQDLDELFVDALPHIEAVANELGQPTEFEVVTFLGLWHFARQRVDAAVLEVGLGGKWDATNATNPLVSVVTHVAMDHMDRLGNTLEEIAADKVCIARAGRRFITAEHKPQVLRVFEAHCEAIGAPMLYNHLASTDFQKVNKITAFAAVLNLFKACGWPVSGLAEREISLEVRGRFEQLNGEPTVVIDGANNPDGAQFLAEELARRQIQPENLVLILGILADKDWQQMTQILAPLAKTVICTQSDSPRALSAERLVDEARKWNANVEMAPSVREAVQRARELAATEDVILVTGSFTTIAEVPRES